MQPGSRLALSAGEGARVPSEADASDLKIESRPKCCGKAITLILPARAE